MSHVAGFAVGLVATIASVGATAASADWPAVDHAIGCKGMEQPGGVYKYSVPRSDLRVTLGGVRIKPALALGGWVALACPLVHPTWVLVR